MPRVIPSIVFQRIGRRTAAALLSLLTLSLLMPPLRAHAQPGTVLSEQVLATGGLVDLEADDDFGQGPTRIGDLDGDGTDDAVVGAPRGDFGVGSLYVLFMNTDGTFRDRQQITEGFGAFSGDIGEDFFGSAAAGLGDLDGDGTPDIAVGARGDDDGGGNRGAVWILFMNPDGTVKGEQKISDTAGGFTGGLDDGDTFGRGVATLGDLDGDGVVDLAVGAERDDDGGANRGAVWILFLNPDGTVKGHQKISSTSGGFGGVLDDSDDFGTAVAGLGDLDGDGVGDLAVGAGRDDDGGSNQGAVWILLMNSDGTVKSHQKISDTAGGFGGALGGFDAFGTGVAQLGDLDGDGVVDLAVGAPDDDDGGSKRGAVWVLFLNPDGTVKSEQKISDTAGGLLGRLDDFDQFGRAVGSLGDLDGDGVGDLMTGLPFRDSDELTNTGAAYVLFLNADGTVRDEREISRRQGFSIGGFRGGPNNGIGVGFGLASLGDFDGDGVTDYAVSDAIESVYLLFMNPDGTVRAEQRIAEGVGGFVGGSTTNYRFGESVAAVGDLDGDDVTDLAVGAPGNPLDSFDGAAVWILFMNPDGTVRTEQKIAEGIGGFGGNLLGGGLGAALAPLGDLDGDGVADLAVGTWESISNIRSQSVWILFLNPDGTVKSEQQIAAGIGGFPLGIREGDRFASALAPLGDFNGDGVVDLAVGARGDDDGGENRGGVYILFLNADGTVADVRKISGAIGGFTGTLDDFDGFGQALAPVGDLNGDGAPDLAVGADQDDDGGISLGKELGAVWVIFLNLDLDQEPALGHQKISDTAGGLVADLEDFYRFGSSLAPAGDLNGDGVFDLVVGARGASFLDSSFDQGAVYLLALGSTATAVGPSPPQSTVFMRSDPNPFVGATAIRYFLPRRSSVRLTVYDVSGRRVRELADERREEGWHVSHWDGRTSEGGQAARGVYFLRLATPEATRSLKVVRVY